MIDNTFTNSPTFQAVLNTLNLYFPKPVRKSIRIIDLGCCEGNNSVGFAFNEYQALGIEARKENFEKCDLSFKTLQLPNLYFIQDDVKNIEKYGKFDVVFCSGILYHLDNPYDFLKKIGNAATEMLILNTHYAVEGEFDRKLYHLSEITEHEGKRGRWYPEVTSMPLAAFSNDKSFWLLKKDLLQSLKEVGFSVVYEQYDFLGNIAKSDYIERHNRSMFVAFK